MVRISAPVFCHLTKNPSSKTRWVKTPVVYVQITTFLQANYACGMTSHKKTLFDWNMPPGCDSSHKIKHVFLLRIFWRLQWSDSAHTLIFRGGTTFLNNQGGTAFVIHWDGTTLVAFWCGITLLMIQRDGTALVTLWCGTALVTHRGGITSNDVVPLIWSHISDHEMWYNNI